MDSLPPPPVPCVCGWLSPCPYSQSNLTGADLAYCAECLQRSALSIGAECHSIIEWLTANPATAPGWIECELKLTTLQGDLHAVKARRVQVLFHQQLVLQKESVKAVAH